MRIHVLGCSAGIGAGLRTTSLLIDDDILIDCGTGVGDLGLDRLVKIRHVFLTHSHLDHIVSLPLFIDTAFEYLRQQPLILHCQDVTYRVLRRHIFNSEIWPDFFALPDPATAVVSFEPLAGGQTVGIDGRSIRAIEVNHAVPGVAYRIEGARHALAFSGDTSENDSLWEALNQHAGLDLLLVECAFPEAERELSIVSGHYCPSLLAQDLRKLKYRPRIYITHLKPGAEESTMAEIRSLLPQFEVNRLTGGERFEL
jgi:ribonuclease BN (tRNA processing enzyme)